MRSLLIFMVFLLGSHYTFSHLQAQSVTDELAIQTFTRNFMVAYNQQDAASLKKMYLKDAVRVDANGKEINGADEIGAYFDQQFIKNNTTLLLKPSNIVWSDSQHAYLASGTYEIYGKTNVYDIKIQDTGAYTNTMIKEKGAWKIAESVLGSLVKVIVHHKIQEFPKWKSVFERERSKRLAAGELNAEIGTLYDDPQTAYIISEWKSIAHFQNFLEDPDLKQQMQEAGVSGEPTILILDRK